MDNYNKLIELIALLNTITDFDETLRITLRKISEFVDTEAVSVLMLNPQTQDTIKTLLNEEKFNITGKYHYLNSAIAGWVIKNNNSFMSNDLKNDDRFKENLFNKSPFNKCICVPIISAGNIIGVIIAFRSEIQKQFTQTDFSVLDNIGSVISPYIYNAQKIQEYFLLPKLSDDALLKKYFNLGLIGHSSQFIEMLKAIDSAAKCDVRVLLEGETGTGKELIARAIHKLSSRSNEKMITLDCGAFPPNLIEGELFGHLKGAFTGAISDRKGLLEEAKNGTLFIDEVSLLPLELQSRFLRFIQEGEFRQIGSNETKKVDVRIIAASSTSLLKQINDGSFREELYYRLNVYPIEIPSLKKRTDDIPILTNTFVKKYSIEQSKAAETVDEKIMHLLLNLQWRGNIRELENFCERLVTLIPPDINIISVDFLPAEFKKQLKKLKTTSSEIKNLKPLEKALEEYEEQLIRIALIKNNWNQLKAAEAIQIKEQTLRYKMKKLSIVPPN